MTLPERQVYIRNYVMGVLAEHKEKSGSFFDISRLADEIVGAAIEGDLRWQQQARCVRELVHEEP